MAFIVREGTPLLFDHKKVLLFAVKQGLSLAGGLSWDYARETPPYSLITRRIERGVPTERIAEVAYKWQDQQRSPVMVFCARLFGTSNDPWRLALYQDADLPANWQEILTSLPTLDSLLSFPGPAGGFHWQDHWRRLLYDVVREPVWARDYDAQGSSLWPLWEAERAKKIEKIKGFISVAKSYGQELTNLAQELRGLLGGDEEHPPHPSHQPHTIAAAKISRAHDSGTSDAGAALFRA